MKHYELLRDVKIEGRLHKAGTIFTDKDLDAGRLESLVNTRHAEEVDATKNQSPAATPPEAKPAKPEAKPAKK